MKLWKKGIANLVNFPIFNMVLRDERAGCQINEIPPNDVFWHNQAIAFINPIPANEIFR